MFMLKKRNLFKTFAALAVLQISFLASTSHASRQCIKFLISNKSSNVTVAGNISILRTEARSEEASFLNFSEKSYINAELSSRLLNQLHLLNQKETNSLTEFRVEEKAVIKGQQAATFLADSNQRLELSWQLRDVPPVGEKFLTVTAYGKTFQLTNPGSHPIVGKLRIRKYYSHSEKNSNNLRQVFPNISSLELKISNIGRFDPNGQPVVVENGVFKPRIHISDAQLVQLLQISKGKFESTEAIDKLITEISELRNPETHQLFNKPEQVRQMLETLQLLQTQAPRLLETDKVIAYNRKSYSALDKSGHEYQFTLDEKIRVFAGNPKILCCSLEKYLTEKPLEILPSEYVFAELKSPVSAKLQNNSNYIALYSSFIKEHFGTLNQGKYSLSSKKLSHLFEENSNKILEERGALLWLIRGASFSPEPQNRKSIVEHGQVKIGIPFNYQNQVYRVVVEYKTLVTTNAKREAFVDKIQIVDHAGRKIDLKDSDFKELLRSFRDVSDKDLAGILIEGQPIIIKPKINAEELKAYIDFFNDFFVNFTKSPKNPRDPEILQNINSVKQLNWYRTKLKMQNFVSYSWSRIHRFAMGAAIGAAIIWYAPFYSDKAPTQQAPQTVVEHYIIEVRDASGQSRYFDPVRQQYIEKDSLPADYQPVNLSEIPVH